MIRRIRPPTSLGACVSTRANTPTAQSEISPRNSPFAPRKMAIATTGRNSPTAPAARMYEPNRPRSMSLSRRVGNRVPSAVVVSPSATGTNARTSPAASRRPTTTQARVTVTNQPTIASRPACSRKSVSSSS